MYSTHTETQVQLYLTETRESIAWRMSEIIRHAAGIRSYPGLQLEENETRTRWTD